VGKKAQTLFGAQAVADVAQQHEEMANAVALEWRAADLQRHLPIMTATGQLQRRVRRGAQQPGGGIAFQQAITRQVAQQLRRSTAEQRCRRRVGLQHAQLAVDHQHADRRGVHQVAEQLLAFAERQLALVQLVHHLIEGSGQPADLVAAADRQVLRLLIDGELACGLVDAGQAARQQAAIEAVEDQSEQQQQRQRLRQVEPGLALGLRQHRREVVLHQQRFAQRRAVLGDAVQRVDRQLPGAFAEPTRAAAVHLFGEFAGIDQRQALGGQTQLGRGDHL